VAGLDDLFSAGKFSVVEEKITVIAAGNSRRYSSIIPHFRG
jgi:hypothetical protein